MCNAEKQPDKKTYIAITIGPIIRTFGLTSTPAALWASSYLFSYIAKSIREKLIEGKYTPKVEETAFISPYPFYKGENVLNRHKDDGLGLLHDHMIFLKPQDFTWKGFRDLRDAVVLEACKNFTLDDAGDKEAPPSEKELNQNLDFLKRYVMIAAVEFQAENPIMGSGKMLDCAELATTFVPREEKNPILAFFTNENDDENRNDQIKARGQKQLGIEPKKWQLLYKRYPTDAEYSVMDLPAIARGGVRGDKMKKHAYYALVRSDGDNMGKLISNLTLDAADPQNEFHRFHTFSGACLAYCESVAQLVKDYEGMTVYAGGDDLLAILPCENKHKKTVFDFVREANTVFAKTFLTNSGTDDKEKTIKDILDEINEQIEKDNKEKGENKIPLPPPSLTWGITLCHKKYPLYEALEDSASLLFGAKDKDYKNAVNLRLIKHSGQTSAVYIQNKLLEDENGTFFSLLRDILGRTKEKKNGSDTAETEAEQKEADAREANKEKQNDDILLTCLHTFHEARAVFLLADANNTKDLFKNMFDADVHEENNFLHVSLPKLYKDHCLTGQSCALNDDGEKVMTIKEEREVPDAPEALHYLLRILKFFVEKAEESEKAGEKE